MKRLACAHCMIVICIYCSKTDSKFYHRSRRLWKHLHEIKVKIISIISFKKRLKLVHIAHLSTMLKCVMYLSLYWSKMTFEWNWNKHLFYRRTGIDNWDRSEGPYILHTWLPCYKTFLLVQKLLTQWYWS